MKLLIIFFSIILFLTAVFLPLNTKLKTKTTEKSVQTVPVYPASYEKDNYQFYVAYSGILRRGNSEYQLEDHFSYANFINPANSERIKSLDELIESQKNKRTLYRMELLDSSGNNENYFTHVSNCPPGGDVCMGQFDNEEMPPNRSGVLNLWLKITPSTVGLNFYVNGILVKTLSNFDVKKYGSSCEYAEICKNIAALKCYSEADEPLYYIDNKSGKIIGHCGSSCAWDPKNKSCRNCQPKEWTCN